MINLFFGPMIGLAAVPGMGPWVELKGGGSLRDCGIDRADCAAKFPDAPGPGKGDTEGAGANPLAWEARPGASIIDIVPSS